MCDELDDAAAEAETALEVADRLDIVRTRRLTRAVLAVIEVDRGRVDDARRALDGATLPADRTHSTSGRPPRTCGWHRTVPTTHTAGWIATATARG
ncbi:hypothetical protein ACFQV8_25385 [Pseudonocardia benzenivorans]